MTVVNRVVMVVLSLAVLAAGSIGAVEAVLAWVGRDGWLIDRRVWNNWLVDRSWDSPVIGWVLLGFVVVGIALIAMQVKPRRPTSYPAGSPVDGVTVAVDRHGLETLAQSAAEDDVDVADARAGLRRRVLRIRLEAFPDVDGTVVRDRVRQSVSALVGATSLKHPVKVHVQARTSQRRAR